MKNKLGIIGAVLLFFVSCGTKDEISLGRCYPKEKDVVAIAMNALEEFYPGTRSSGFATAFIEPLFNRVGDTVAISVYSKTNGFVVLSADLSDIILVSQSNFNNAVESGFVDNIVNSYSSLYSAPLKPDLPIPPPITGTRVERDTSITEIGPMVSVLWHQNEPFNRYATNEGQKLAGCTPVAIAQVMSYYEYPTSISLSFSGAPYSDISLNWPAMISSNGDHGNSCGECMQKACLLRQIGKICHANYNENSTNAWPRSRYLDELGYYGDEYDNYDLGKITSSLDNNYPCIISAFNSEAGHTWVIDGYKRETHTTIFYETGLLGEIETDRTVSLKIFLHFNYGWRGHVDAYCIALHREYGSGSHIYGGSYDYYPVSMFTPKDGYTDVQMLVTNIHPIVD